MSNRRNTSARGGKFTSVWDMILKQRHARSSGVLFNFHITWAFISLSLSHTHTDTYVHTHIQYVRLSSQCDLRTPYRRDRTARQHLRAGARACGARCLSEERHSPPRAKVTLSSSQLTATEGNVKPASFFFVFFVFFYYYWFIKLILQAVSLLHACVLTALRRISYQIGEKKDRESSASVWKMTQVWAALVDYFNPLSQTVIHFNSNSI